MTEIDFLPLTFAHEQRRNRRTVFHIAIVALVAVSMGLWYRAAARQIVTLESQANEAEAAVASSYRNEAQSQQLKDQQAALLRQTNLQAQLTAPLTPSQILGILTSVTPQGVAMSSVSIAGQRTSPETPGTVASKVSNKSGKSAAPPPPLTIRLAGIAPNEMEVANLVGQLTGQALFRNVKLSFSRPTTIDNLIGREFQIEMEVDMDRTFQIQPGAEVADAR